LALSARGRFYGRPLEASPAEPAKRGNRGCHPEKPAAVLCGLGARRCWIAGLSEATLAERAKVAKKISIGFHPKRSVGVLCALGARRGCVSGLARAFLAEIAKVAKVAKCSTNGCYPKKPVGVLRGLGALCPREVLRSASRSIARRGRRVLKGGQ